MTVLDLVASVFGISALVNFSARPAVIRLLKRVEAFESLGAPRTFFYSDALPLRSVLLPLQSAKDKALVVLYFLSWVSFFAFGLASLALLLGAR